MELDGNVTSENQTLGGQIIYDYGIPVLLVVCLISVLINISILMSLYWIRKPVTSTLYISLSLAAADAFTSFILGIDLFFNSYLPKKWNWEKSGTSCFNVTVNMLKGAGQITTVMHLLALTFNHYLGIFTPLHYASVMTKHNTTWIIFLLWIIPLIIMTTTFSLIPDQLYQNCSQYSITDTFSYRAPLSAFFFISLFIMILAYTHILFIVHRQQNLWKRMGNARSQGPFGRPQQALNINIKALHTTLWILASFTIGWIPASLLFMLYCGDCPLTVPDTPLWFLCVYVILCLILLKTLMNPIIYAARMIEIKEATKRMLAFAGGRRFTPRSANCTNQMHLQRSVLSSSMRSRSTIYRVTGDLHMHELVVPSSSPEKRLLPKHPIL